MLVVPDDGVIVHYRHRCAVVRLVGAAAERHMMVLHQSCPRDGREEVGVVAFVIIR